MKYAQSAGRRVCLVFLAAVLLFALAGCGSKSPLDPKNPVSLTV